MEELTSKEKTRASRYLFFTLGLILWLIQGCAGVGPDLEKAREQNTEQAYLAVSYTHLTLPTKCIV